MIPAENRSAPTLYEELNVVLLELLASLQSILGDSLVGLYLQGSFATGGFDRDSDVDFIVALEQDLSDDQVAALQEMHNRIYQLDYNWAQHLEGSYIALDALRPAPRPGQPLWYLDHGARSLVLSDHCNTLVVRSVLREHGITLFGPEPDTLIDPVPLRLLRQEISQVMRDWGEQILADPAPFNNRFYQGYIVLNYCRMLHDLVSGSVGSKTVGAEWAKANLDPSWSALIDRAWAGRHDPARSSREPVDPEEFALTLKFLRYILEKV